MTTSTSRIAQLKEMIALEEKRATLQSQVEKVDHQLSALQGALYGQPAKAVTAPVAARKSAGKPPRKARGALREQILEALQAAGAKGATVKELSALLGIKNTHLHSWFSAAGKKLPQIKKVGPSHYALSGAAQKAAVEAKPAKAAKAPKAAKAVKAPKAAKAPKAEKPAKAAKGKGTRRGALKDKIVAALQEAGSAGVTVKDLSDKLGVKYRNLYIWFVTTGKRIPGLKKAGPAQYKLEA